MNTSSTLKRFHLSPMLTAALDRKSFGIGMAMLTSIVLVTVLAPYLGTMDPTAINPANRLRPPSAEHWFGTDMHGRDLYSRTVFGGQISLVVGLSVAALASVIGGLIGLVAGFVRVADNVMMRMIDGVMSIPPIMLSIALMALTSASVRNVIIAVTIGEIPQVARLVRSVVLSLRGQTFVEASVTMGASTWRLIFRHILPNAIAPLIVQATFICAAAMLAEAALSFIGAGSPPEIPSWGNMMAEARALWQISPAMIFLPACFLTFAVLAINLVGDGLRELLDPRSARLL